MPSRFLADKVPYLVTLVFGVLGWTLVHIDDELTQSPTVESQEVQGASAGVQPLPCEGKKAPDDEVVAKGFDIENLSRSTSFSSLEFVLHSRDSDPRFQGVRLVPDPPAVLPDEAEPETCGADYAKFQIPQLQPGWRFRLLVWMPKNKPDPYLTYSTDEAVRLEPQSWETSAVRHERSILEGFAGVAALILILWAIFSKP